MAFRNLAKSPCNIVWFVLLAIAFIGCGSEKSPITPAVQNHTVYILVPYPNEPLFDSVVVVRASVAGQGIATPISTSQPINRSSSWLVLAMMVPEGNSRVFAVYGLNSSNVELYHAFIVSDIAGPGNTYLTANLQRVSSPPQQTTYLLIPHPNDWLFSLVDSIGITITGDSIETPLYFSSSVNTNVTYTFLPLVVPDGVVRHFDIFGLGGAKEKLYRNLLSVAMPDTGDLFLTLELTQIGYANPDRIKIFRNVIPFGNWAELDSILISIGFTEGTGDGHFQVFGSAYMGSLSLIPDRDLLIFEGWQNLAYYVDYMNARTDIESFIDSGGVALYMANEGGAHDGLYSQAGMQFPSGVTFVSGTDNINLLTLPQHNILANLPDTLTGYAASHGSLGNLPQGRVVLLTDSAGRPTLVAFPKGRGLVVMSTHPLEYLYHYRDQYTCGTLLSRLIRFMTGNDPTPNP